MSHYYKNKFQCLLFECLGRDNITLKEQKEFEKYDYEEMKSIEELKDDAEKKSSKCLSKQASVEPV